MSPSLTFFTYFNTYVFIILTQLLKVTFHLHLLQDVGYTPHVTQFIHDSMDMSLGKLREMVKDRETWHAAVYGISESLARLGD